MQFLCSLPPSRPHLNTQTTTHQGAAEGTWRGPSRVSSAGNVASRHVTSRHVTSRRETYLFSLQSNSFQLQRPLLPHELRAQRRRGADGHYQEDGHQ